MSEELERLLDSLLYEGYALYPYTPAATKNATPTPFGIVYPRQYAANSSSTFDHLELRCLVHAAPQAQINAEVRFLSACGERHQAEAQRVSVPQVSLAELAGFAAERGQRPGLVDHVSAGLCARVRLRAHERASGSYELALRVENRTPAAGDLDRRAALERSLLSTHPVLRVTGGRFSSPLDDDCVSVNTFPVLAGERDEAIIGAAIVLPDHPQIAPESRGALFDSTEIEEALLLHVHALSDAEREEIERQDPAVREMVARAAASTPEDIIALHGRVRISDPRPRTSESPPEEPAGLPDPSAGEPEALVDGVRFRRGGKVRIRPGEDADIQARMLDGRVATIERILVDYDGRTHLGLTIDDDPGQQLMRETGRLLYFFAPELEPIGLGADPAGRGIGGEQGLR